MKKLSLEEATKLALQGKLITESVGYDAGICPDCGSDDLTYDENPVTYTDSIEYYYQCNNCGKKGVELYNLDFVEMSSDGLNENKKVESLRQDTKNAIDLAINEIDNGNCDDPEWFANKYKTYEDVVNGVYKLLNSNLNNGFGLDDEPTHATKFSGKDAIFAEIKRQLANWGYTEDYFTNKR